MGQLYSGAYSRAAGWQRSLNAMVVGLHLSLAVGKEIFEDTVGRLHRAVGHPLHVIPMLRVAILV